MIRQATQDDIPAVKTLMQSEPGFWQDSWRDDVLERGLTAAGALAFVCEEAGQVVGFVCANDLGFRGYLNELIVAESVRSKGIGRQLVRKVEQELQAQGCAIVISDVWRDAEGFYKSLGWSEPEVVLLRKKLDDESSQQPDDPSLPFIAYGVFRKGELGYLSIADLVEAIEEPVSVPGCLYLRDGLPVLDVTSGSTVAGTLIHFWSGSSREAYERINRIEPDKQYRWETVHVAQTRCNCLAGRSPRKGSVPADEGWNGRKDPLFTSAIDVIQETLDANAEFDWDLRPMFRLQMAYLLLWSAIERYASLRYHLGDKPVEKVMEIADDPVFAHLLRSHVSRTHRVQRADRPRDHCVLNPSSPVKSLSYYYQIRSNITHRGKAVVRDHETVRESLRELLCIFDQLLDAAFDASAKAAPKRCINADQQ
ncbi:GNAT family N-acetyltransferase [Candidatus Bipolaricaulota bacterium]|nr:GNAT family N-acetyltransferase [Candidatus Bipolaricaulota bacterium]